MKVKKTGDWMRVGTILRGAPRMSAAIWRALQREAQATRKDMVLGLRDQAPGGQEFKPLGDTTLVGRREAGFDGTKALIRHGDLMGSISVKSDRGALQVFVGVPRTAKGRNGDDLVNVAGIHEFGAGPFVVRQTAKSHAYVMMLLRKSGREIRRKAPKTVGIEAQTGVFVITIPARPFVSPVLETRRPGFPDRMRAALDEVLRG